MKKTINAFAIIALLLLTGYTITSSTTDLTVGRDLTITRNLTVSGSGNVVGVLTENGNRVYSSTGTGLTSTGAAVRVALTTTTCLAGSAEIATAADGTSTCGAFGTSSLTNGASSNVIPKSNGTNLVTSSLTDDGTTFAVGSTALTVTESSGNTAIAGTLNVVGALTENSNRVYSSTGSGLTSSTSTVKMRTDCTGTYVLAWNSGGSTWDCTNPTSLSGVASASSISGTTNTIAKFSSSTAVGNSAVTDDGTTFSVGSSKLTVTEASGNTAVAGTFLSSGLLTASVGITSTVGPNTFGGTSTFNNGPTGLHPYGGKHLEFFDDHMDQNRLNAGTPNGWQQAVVSGTATIAPDATNWTTRPGVQLYTVTTTNARVSDATSVAAIDFGSYGTATYEDVLGVPTLSTSGDEFEIMSGFFDVFSGVNETDGCYFLYDRGNTATTGPNSGNAQKLSCWCVSGGTRTASEFLMDGSTVSDESFTTVNAPVAAVAAPNTNWMDLKVVVTGTTRAEFYVNGVKSCDITHNIPSATHTTGAGHNVFKSNGNTNLVNAMVLDFSALLIDLTTARS